MERGNISNPAFNLKRFSFGVHQYCKIGSSQLQGLICSVLPYVVVWLFTFYGAFKAPEMRMLCPSML